MTSPIFNGIAGALDPKIALVDSTFQLLARLTGRARDAEGREERPSRVIRAIEVFETSGKPISEWQRKGTPDFEFLLFGVHVPREVLYPRVDRRVVAMFEGGLLDEVRTLLDCGLSPDAPAMSSISYAEAIKHLAGELTLAEAIEKTQITTHRLIRSQDQWFRREDNRITWVEDADGIDMQANIFTGACTNVIRGEGRR